MYNVSGSNIHGQWLDRTTNHALHGFPTLKTTNVPNIDEAQITSITWAYNIFLVKNDFNLAGSWAGAERQVTKVSLPEKYPQATKDLTLVGNDRTLFLCNVKTYDLWTLDLPETEDGAGNWNWSHKKLDLLEHSERDVYIKKILVSHSDTPHILTSNGIVYEYPVKIDTSHCIGKVCDLDYGMEHSILLTDAGKVYTWGNGKRCQLGHGDLTSLHEPTEVEALAGLKIIKISAGGWHSFALSESGDLYAWGWNDAGQLGVKDNIKEDLAEGENEKILTKRGNSCALPTLLDFYDTETENWLDDVVVKHMACGNRHSAVVLEDNTVWTAGLNKYGQLGFCCQQTQSLSYFKIALKSDSDCTVLCGPWCTVVKKSRK